MMNYWQNLYLPNPTKMVVFGIVEDVPCLAPAQQLVILVAEDGKVYAYEEEELHLVGDSVQKFLHEGLRLFKQSVSYRCGQGLESEVSYIAGKLLENVMLWPCTRGISATSEISLFKFLHFFLH